jgi:hypothetical protein
MSNLPSRSIGPISMKNGDWRRKNGFVRLRRPRSSTSRFWAAVLPGRILVIARGVKQPIKGEGEERERCVEFL